MHHYIDIHPYPYTLVYDNQLQYTDLILYDALTDTDRT